MEVLASFAHSDLGLLGCRKSGQTGACSEWASTLLVLLLLLLFNSACYCSFLSLPISTMIPSITFALGKRTVRRIGAEDADMQRSHYVELFFSVDCATTKQLGKIFFPNCLVLRRIPLLMLLPQIFLHSSAALSSEAYTLDLSTWHFHMCSMCTCGACQQGLASPPSNCSTTNQPIVLSFTVQGSGFKPYRLNDIQGYPLV